MQPARTLACLLALSLPLAAAATAVPRAQDPFSAPERFSENLDFMIGVAAFDADGDLDDDVIASTNSEGVWYFESTGDGQARLGVRVSDGRLVAPIALDVDGAGALDVVALRAGVGVVVLRNRAGRFASE